MLQPIVSPANWFAGGGRLVYLQSSAPMQQNTIYDAWNDRVPYAELAVTAFVGFEGNRYVTHAALYIPRTDEPYDEDAGFPHDVHEGFIYDGDDLDAAVKTANTQLTAFADAGFVADTAFRGYARQDMPFSVKACREQGRARSARPR